jgi:hypothetical protein
MIDDAVAKYLFSHVGFLVRVNTAILTQVITPFSATIGPGSKDVLPTINALLWSELFLSPFLRLLDIVGNLKKHILGPRAKTQESMNLSFQGTAYNLGERYTVSCSKSSDTISSVYGSKPYVAAIGLDESAVPLFLLLCALSGHLFLLWCHSFRAILCRQVLSHGKSSRRNLKT